MEEEDGDVKRIGITEVYAAENPEVDIVFVHGLNGHPHRTWTGKKSNVFWPVQLLPKDLLKKKDNVRILVYGYNADVYAYGGSNTSSDKIHNHAQTLIQTLYANRSLDDGKERPIVFVCHSLGGIIVKRALQYSKSILAKSTEHLRSIYVCTYGIIFFGTPHLGSDTAKMGKMLQNIARAMIPSKVVDSQPQLIAALQANSETLQNINLEFAQFQKRFHLYFFHEAHKTSLGVTLDYIVDEASASPLVDGAEYAGIEATHSNMCKFDSKNSPGYDLVAEALQRFASAEAVATIKARWQQDKKDVQEIRISEAREAVSSYSNENDAAQTQPSPHLHPEQHMITSGPNTPHVEPSPTLDPSPPPKDLYTDEPLIVVPPDFTPNSLFVGMQTELTELDKLLFDAKKRAEGTACVLLWCLAGGGKTHLARQYLYTQKQKFKGGAFWVSAKSLEELVDGFWRIAQKAALKGLRDPRGFSSQQEIEAFIEPVKDWFESREEWLLVFDGVTADRDGDLTDLRRFIPNRQNSSIIYTSVDRTLARKHLLLNPVALKVEQLKALDAQELLFQELDISRPSQADKGNATELVQKMQYLPLMIHASARYMKTTGLPLKSYLKSYSKGKLELLEPYQRIFETLKGSFFEATNLISILCFFSSHIPVEMLQLGIRVMHQLGFPVKMMDKTGEDLNKTIGILIKYALVDRNELDDCESSQSHQEPLHDMLKMHSVVQDFACEFLGEEKYKWLMRAVKVFCRSYSEADSRIRGKRGIGTVSDFHQYKVHGQRLLRHVYRYEKEHRELDAVRLELDKTMESITLEIQKKTPSSSLDIISRRDGEPFPVSVFDRSSSSSSLGPDTPPARDMSTVSTWGLEPGKPHVESPTAIITGHLLDPSLNQSQLLPLPSYTRDDAGYTSDRDEPGQSSGTTPTIPQTTPRPEQIGAPDDGWEEVTRRKPNRPDDRPQLHRTISDRRRRRHTDRLGTWRNLAPAAVDPRVNRATAEGLVTTRPIPRKSESVTGNSPAQIALSKNFQKSSPPGSSRGGGSIWGRRRDSNHSIDSTVLSPPNLKPTSYAAALTGNSSPDMRRGPSGTGSSGSGGLSHNATTMRRDRTNESAPSYDKYPLIPAGSSPPSRPIVQSAPPMSAGLPLPPDGRLYEPLRGPSPRLSYANPIHFSDPTLGSLPGLGNYRGQAQYADFYGLSNPDPLPYIQIPGPLKRSVPQDFRGHDRSDEQGANYYNPASSSSMHYGHPQSTSTYTTGQYLAGYSSQPMSRQASDQSVDMARSTAETEPARYPPAMSPPLYPHGLNIPRERERHLDGAPVRKSPKYTFAEASSADISPIPSPTATSAQHFTADQTLRGMGEWADERVPSPPQLLGEHGRHSSERSSGPGINKGGRIVQFGDAASVDVNARSAQLYRDEEQRRFKNGYYRPHVPHLGAPYPKSPYPPHNLMPRTTSDVANMVGGRPRGLSAPGQAPPPGLGISMDFPDEGVEIQINTTRRRITEEENELHLGLANRPFN